MKKGDEKMADEMKMPADEFDRIMRGALGVPAPVKATPRPERQPRKGGKAAKK